MSRVALVLAVGFCASLGEAEAFVPSHPEQVEAYCHPLRVMGFGEPSTEQRVLACREGARARSYTADGFYAKAKDALERSLAAWDLPHGHLLMARVDANLGRPLEALEHAWRAALHDGRGLMTDELEVLALLERHLLDHEFGHVVVGMEALGGRIGRFEGATLTRDGQVIWSEAANAHLLLAPGSTRLELRVGGELRWVRVVEVRAGMRHELDADGHGSERPRDPGEAGLLAASRIGVPVDVAGVLRALKDHEAEAQNSMARRRAEQVNTPPCAKLEQREAALCALLAADYRRYADRLRALEIRARELVDGIERGTR